MVGLLLSVVIFPLVPQELAPTEDRGIIILPTSAPRGATVDYTDHHMKKVEAQLVPYQEAGLIESLLTIVGFREEADRGFIIMRLTPWDARTVKQQAITAELFEKLSTIPGVRAVAVNPPGLGQRGFNQPLEIVLGGPDYETVQRWSEELLSLAQKNPGLQNLESDFELTRP